jgi:type VI protein secretion system component VasA
MRTELKITKAQQWLQRQYSLRVVLRVAGDVEHKQLIISKLPVTLSIDTSLETSQTPLLFASSINTLKSNNDVKKRAIIRSLFPVVTDAQLFAANL